MKKNDGLKRTKFAAKQFLYLQVDRFLRNGRNYDTALDLGCGSMYLADVVKTKTYVGVDLDQEKLRKGIAAHPRATAIQSRVEDLPSETKGDIVICLQCIALNKHFEIDETLSFVDRMIQATRPGGDLVFNVGDRGFDYLEEIGVRIQRAFSHSHHVDYGRFRGRFVNDRLGRHLALPLARLMQMWPWLANTSVRKRRLYLCQQKRTDLERT